MITWHPRCSFVFIGPTLALLISCTGEVTGATADNRHDFPGPASSSGGGSAGVGTQAIDPGPASFRRITNAQYENTVRSILGVDRSLIGQLGSDRSLSAYANGEQQAAPSTGIVQGYGSAAHLVAEAAVTVNARASLFDAAACGDQATCITTFVQQLGRRLYRRPLSEAEVAAIATGAIAEAQSGDFWVGARFALEVMLQSVPFLYVVDEGSATGDFGGLLRRTPHAVATRLALLLWDEAPDDALLDLADSGGLQTTESVSAEVSRMLGDARFKRAARSFFQEWFGYDLALSASKDAMHVDFQPDLVRSLVDETNLLVDHFIANDLPASGLFSANYSFGDDRVRAFYAADQPAGLALDPLDSTRFLLPPARRGILSHASFIAANSGPGNQSPTTRGLGVYRRFLCGTIASPPPTAPAELPEDENVGPQTIRERTETFMLANPTCSGCHNHMDRIGFLFEQFDAAGKFRTLEAVPDAPGGQKPVDAKGAILALGLSEVDGLPGLAEAFGSRDEVSQCLLQNVVSWGLGREASDTDAPLLAHMKVAMDAGGGAFKVALRHLAENAVLVMRKRE